MHADAFFAIGKSHIVCEDYARAGEEDLTGAFAIVSDGCSSSQDTDFGARFLTMAALRYLAESDGLPDPTITAYMARGSLPSLITDECLDATLLLARENVEGHVEVVAYGDGAIAARTREGEIFIWQIKFERGTPAYPSYLLDPVRLRDYVREGYGQREVRLYIDGELRTTQDTPITLIEEGETAFRVRNFPVQMCFDPDYYETVMLLSDGADSFQKKGPTITWIPLPEIVDALMGFKTFKGQFVVRRCKSFLNRFCQRQGWEHYDDLAVAAIHLGDD